MPQIESQKKRVITNRKSYELNRNQKQALRTVIRNLHNAVIAEDKEAAVALLKVANKLLDRGVTSNIHHKNFANRHKSACAKLVNTLS